MNRWFLVSILLTILSLGVPLFLYFGRLDLLRDPIPTHFNAVGEVDRWTPRDHILPQWLVIPGMMVGFLILTAAMPWMSPKGFQIDRFRGTFSSLMAAGTMLFAYIQLLIVLGALQGVQLDLSRWLLGGISLFFSVIGNRLGKVQRNFWMGVRTPWTLASEAVWIQTHRLTAWLWVPGGIVLSIIGFAGLSVWLWLTGLLLIALAPVVYSLWLYKRLENQGKLSPTPSPTEELR